MRRDKIIILTSVLVDVLGFGIVIPILPFYVGEFGASPTTITLMFATFSFFAFLSAPVLGGLSDRIGRRPVLILSITTTALGWFVFASAQSLWQLFLGRIIDGMAAGNFTTAQNYMVDISKDEKERTHNLGIVGAMFGIGFVLGPFIGGILSKISHAFPFWIAGAMAACNAISAFFFLPETHKNRNMHSSMSFNPFIPLIRAAKHKVLRPLYFFWSFFAFAIVSTQSVFGLFMKDVFDFTAFQTGMLFTITGIVIVLNQVHLLTKFWMVKFSQSSLIIVMLFVLASSSLLAATEILTLFFVALIFSGTGQAVLRVVITSQAAAKSDPSQKGETLGILASLMSAYMVIAPLLSGFIYEIHPSFPFLVSAALLIVGGFYSIQQFKTR
jgi:DHA1 family tetracycline resistance protein-like MFS transporter